MIISITEVGRARVNAVLPGHEQVVRRLFFDPLSREGSRGLTELLAPVREHMREVAPPSAAPSRRPRRPA